MKLGISLGVFVCSTLVHFVLRLLGKKPKGFCEVLYYHSIPASQRMLFVRQLEMLLQYAIPIPVGDRIALKPGKRYAGVTFDDGFENFATVALPELRKRKIPSTVFVIADALGKAFGCADRFENIMSSQQVQALPLDHVTIGSHTSSHPFLPSLSTEDARREIARSRMQIEEILNRKVLLFSFPFGGFNEDLVRICHDAGYQRVFTTLPFSALAAPDEFVVGRVRVDPTDWPLEFRLKLAGAYRWLPFAFAFKRKLFSNMLIRWISGDYHRRYSETLAAQQSAIQESSRPEVE